MSGRKAVRLLIIICFIIAFLLLVDVIGYITGGVIFAAALVILGIISKGFSKKDKVERI